MSEQTGEFLKLAAETSPKKAAEQVQLSDEDLNNLVEALINSWARDEKEGIVRNTGIGRLVLALQMTRKDSNRMLETLDAVIDGQRQIAKELTRQAEVFCRLAEGIDGLMTAWKAERSVAAGRRAGGQRMCRQGRRHPPRSRQMRITGRTGACPQLCSRCGTVCRKRFGR